MVKIKSITKRYHWLTKVRFDRRTGFYFYLLDDNRIYIRHPRHFVPVKETKWLCENIFFRHYLPRSGDQVVDLGVGYGEEAACLKAVSPGVRYLGVEPQPVVYECVANTFRELGEGFRVSPFAISDADEVKFDSQFSYAGVGNTDAGYIEIPSLRWPAFLERYGVDKIDLLKMNIEGAERDVIQSIADFGMIKRFVVSCHDFRADHGHGESYRTKKFVTAKLADVGYKVIPFALGMNWSDDWVFATRE